MNDTPSFVCTPEAAWEMFERWKSTLEETDDPRFAIKYFTLAVDPSEDFGVFIGPTSPSITLNMGTLSQLQDLVTEFTQISEFFRDTPWHVPAAEMLLELSFQYLMCHEASHWLLGHIEFLWRNNSMLFKQGIGFSEVMLGASGSLVLQLDADENKCAELQADSMAFEMMDVLHTPAPSEESDGFARLRILTVAAGLVILLIEKQRHSGSYPLPATRTFNLLNMVLGVANLNAVAIHRNGPVLSGSDPATLETLGRSLRETILPAGLDLHTVSEILGIETTFLHFKGQLSPTLEDLLLTSGVRKIGDYQTSGAREFASLDRFLHEKMRTAWIPFAKIPVWMPPMPVKISLTAPDLKSAEALGRALADAPQDALKIEELTLLPKIGASLTQVVLEFMATISTGVGSSLLATIISSHCNDHKTSSSQARFTIKIGDIAVECQTKEDLIAALSAAMKGSTSSESE